MSGKRVNRANDAWFLSQVKCGRLKVFKTGKVKNTATNRYIGAVGSGGYPKISLKDLSANKIRHMQIHRLVYLVFVGDITQGHEIHHKDNDKTNCKVSNLEQVTGSYNTRKAIADGLSNTFFKNGNTYHLLRKNIGRVV